MGSNVFFATMAKADLPSWQTLGRVLGLVLGKTLTGSLSNRDVVTVSATPSRLGSFYLDEEQTLQECDHVRDSHLVIDPLKVTTWSQSSSFYSTDVPSNKPLSTRQHQRSARLDHGIFP